MNKKALLSIVGIFMFSLMFVGVSYAYLVYNRDIVDVSLSSGSIDISFTKEENNNSITINQPIADGLGKTLPNYLEFTVNGVADVEAIKYELEIVPKSGNTMNTRYVKLYLTEVENDVEEELCSPLLYDELYDSLANNAKGIYQDLIEGNIDGSSKNYSKTFRLRAWIDESYTNPTLGTFNYEVYLYAINVDATNIHRLTFDMGDERTLSKLVTIGEKYGSLPTPIKKGYVFNGWNGKNKFNEEKYLLISDYHNNDGYSIAEIPLLSNTTYHFNVVRKNNFDGTNNSYLLIDDTTSGNVHWSAIAHPTRPDDCTRPNCNYVTDSNGLLYIARHSNLTQSMLDTIWLNTDVQIEEGSTQTPYEPYYVTSDIEVTEWNTEYKFKAIYGWNNYTYNDEVQGIEIHGGVESQNYISLNGTSSDYIDLGEIIDKREVSIQTTVNIDASNLDNNEHDIINNYNVGGMGIQIISNYLEFCIYLENGNVYRVISTNALSAGIYNIVGIYDGRYLKLYINGVLDNTNDLTNTIITNNLDGNIKNPTSVVNMRIGRHATATNYFKGDIYSAKIYDYAISENKIRNNIKEEGIVRLAS